VILLENWFDKALEMKEKEEKSMTEIAYALGLHYDTVRKKFKKYYKEQVDELDEPEEEFESIQDFILKSARKNVTLEAVADECHTYQEEILSIIKDMQDEGILIEVLSNGRLAISNTPKASYTVEKEVWTGKKHIHIGLVSDTHFCSKTQQLTFLNEVYDIFEERGIETVYHCGDLTDGYGMRREQQFEVFKHGADEFVEYVVENYPRRKGITTKFISGNHDHSFIKSSGLDICNSIAQQRYDMVYLGRSYAKVQLTDNCRMDLVHPLDGSSYAVSYALQKFIEAMPEYDLPQIILSGHHHKYVSTFYRGMYALEVPCTQARTDWERGKRINIQVGAMILNITVDKDGFITRFIPELIPCKNIIENDY
jgi:predicted phosphodiesterase/predicted transcriptional regulator